MKPAMNYETVLEWFDMAIVNAKLMGKLDSALLWTDGKEHLEFMKQQRDELLAALKELEVAGNTVSACYTRNPKNFAQALSAMEHDAVVAREIIAKVEASK